MRTYEYQAKTQRGALEQGTLEAENVAAVQRELTAKGCIALRIREAKPGAKTWQALDRQVLAPTFYPASAKSLSIFFSSMRVMFSAGINVMDMGSILSEQTMHPMLKQAAQDISEAARDGRPMSTVLRKYPACFDAAAVAMIEAGEQSGNMEKVAEALTQYYDRIFELQQMYRGQTFYPKLLLIAILTLPNIVTLIFGGVRAWLSLVLGAGVPILLVIAGLWYGYRVARRIKSFREFMDLIKLSLPWFGSLARRQATARWARAFAMLMKAGVPIHQALLASAATCGNAELELSLVQAAHGVQRGRQLAEVLAGIRQIPRMMKDMIYTAEKAGVVEQALDKAADYYESETEVGGKQTALTIGVLLLVIAGIIVGAIVVNFWGGYFAGLSRMLGSP
jgi:type II secretory pathway component PulF